MGSCFKKALHLASISYTAAKVDADLDPSSADKFH